MQLSIIHPPAPGSEEDLQDLLAVVQQYHNRVVPESLQQRCDEDMDGMMVLEMV